MKIVNRKTRTAMQYEFVRKLSHNTCTKSELFSPNADTPAVKCTVLYLFDNKIAASPAGSNKLYISDAGCQTVTTKARLNALGAGIHAKDKKWYWKTDQEFPSNTWVETVMPLTPP